LAIKAQDSQDRKSNGGGFESTDRIMKRPSRLTADSAVRDSQIHMSNPSNEMTLIHFESNDHLKGNNSAVSTPVEKEHKAEDEVVMTKDLV
jgi:hypothetical protein